MTVQDPLYDAVVRVAGLVVRVAGLVVRVAGLTIAAVRTEGERTVARLLQRGPWLVVAVGQWGGLAGSRHPAAFHHQRRLAALGAATHVRYALPGMHVFSLST